MTAGEADWMLDAHAAFEAGRAGFDIVSERLRGRDDGTRYALAFIEEALQVGEEMLEDLLFEAADADGWEEVTEEELAELIAAGAVEVVPEFLRTDARGASETRTYLTGPRGGVYYIAASGRKVYARKAPAGTTPTKVEPATAKGAAKNAAPTKRKRRSPEEIRTARNARARERRAEKKAEAARKQEESRKAEIEEFKRKLLERESERATSGGAKTREEAATALRSWVATPQFGPTVRDHEVIAVHDALKKCGIDKLYGPDRKLEYLVLGAKQVAPGTDDALDTLKASANGEYSAPYMQGGQHYIKVSERVRNLTPAQKEIAKARIEENAAEVRKYYGDKPVPFVVRSTNPHPIGDFNPETSRVTGVGYKVEVGIGEELTRVTVHEFGHAVHLEPFGKFREADDVVLRTYHSPGRERLSGYAETDHREYFAEAHVAYYHRHDEFKEKAPKAYKMVKDVLKLRGIE